MHYQERHAGRTGGKSQTCGFQTTEHFMDWRMARGGAFQDLEHPSKIVLNQ